MQTIQSSNPNRFTEFCNFTVPIPLFTCISQKKYSALKLHLKYILYRYIQGLSFSRWYEYLLCGFLGPNLDGEFQRPYYHIETFSFRIIHSDITQNTTICRHTNFTQQTVLINHYRH